MLLKTSNCPVPVPVPGQTVEHVCEAEAIFVAQVVELHPKAEKPCLIGNCQAGWQIAMVGSVYPELVGVLILAGAPMSYWTGVRGKNPMRYTGGTIGGSWAVALSSDLGNGRFDGAALVANFEKLNPSNTYWKKAYNLYAKVDTEAHQDLGARVNIRSIPTLAIFGGTQELGRVSGALPPAQLEELIQQVLQQVSR